MTTDPAVRSAFDLSGQVAVVTGGNRGIGLGIASGLARAGSSVAIWGRDRTRNGTACDQLAAAGAEVLAVACDVSSETDVTAAMAATIERFGRVDAMFANAGIGGSTSFLDMPLAEWRRVLSVNLDGTFLCLRAAARAMVEAGTGGSLVAVSSTSAIHGAPRMQHYAASKAGTIALVRGIAVELARHGVRCNALLPGWTETDLTERSRESARFVENTTYRTPLKRWADPAEFGDVAVFLASRQVPFHTGATMVVDGGYTIF